MTDTLRQGKRHKMRYFIYTLSYNGNVFYVGKTNDICRRFSMHITSKKNFPLNIHIRSIISQGYLPILNIITYQPNPYAARLERLLIQSLSNGGQKLFNTQNYRGIRELPDHSDLKAIRKSIRDKQTHYRELEQSKYYRFYTPALKNLPRI